MITGSIVLFSSMSLDYKTVIYACQRAIPAAIIAGILGYIIGKVFESAKVNKNSKRSNNKPKKDPELLIDDLLIDDLDKFSGEKE